MEYANIFSETGKMSKCWLYSVVTIHPCTGHVGYQSLVACEFILCQWPVLLCSSLLWHQLLCSPFFSFSISFTFHPFSLPRSLSFSHVVPLCLSPTHSQTFRQSDANNKHPSGSIASGTGNVDVDMFALWPLKERSFQCSGSTLAYTEAHTLS